LLGTRDFSNEEVHKEGARVKTLADGENKSNWCSQNLVGRMAVKGHANNKE